MERLTGFVTNVARREAEVRAETGNTIERVRNLGATTFEGITDPVRSESWIIRLGRIFDVMRYTDEERLSFAVYLLEGSAYHWWMSVLRQNGGQGNVT